MAGAGADEPHQPLHAETLRLLCEGEPGHAPEERVHRVYKLGQSCFSPAVKELVARARAKCHRSVAEARSGNKKRCKARPWAVVLAVSEADHLLSPEELPAFKEAVVESLRHLLDLPRVRACCAEPRARR